MSTSIPENSNDTMADSPMDYTLTEAAKHTARLLKITPEEAVRDYPVIVSTYALFAVGQCDSDAAYNRHEELTDVLCDMRDTVREIAENLKSNSARAVCQTSPVLDELRSLSERERWQMYEALKAGFFKNHKTYTQCEYDRAIRLYTNLLGV
ncbi:MAG: hypothetical protein HY016_02045 [Nitrosomonadales bacterium]|nr:hypothetical protein [Nitrosomonadales bacterium]